MKTRGHPAARLAGRWWRRTLLVTGVLVALVVAWLASHLVPRDRYFVARRSPLVTVVEEPECREPSGHFSRLVHLTARNGLAVDFRVLRPGGDERPRAAVVLLGGHETGRDAVEVIQDPRTIVVAALDYPYRGPRRPRGVAESLRSVPAIQRGLLDTPPAVSLVADWLVLQRWVDRERVELMGVSLGVPFAAVAGALDPRFRRVWLMHGGVDNRAWLANRLESRISSAPLRHATATLLHLLAYGTSFRTEEWVPRIAPRAVVIVGATHDEEMPRANVERLFAAAREPRELLWSEGGHIRPDRVEIVNQLLDIVRHRID